MDVWTEVGGKSVSFGDLIRERREGIAARWVEEVLSVYPADSGALFMRQKDPFANPLGHSVREGTRGVLDALLDGMDGQEIRRHLTEMVKLRAVQELTPSQALTFVFSLKSVIRQEIPEAEGNPRYSEELAEMDSKIDGVALAAFDLFVEAREEVGRLRIGEVKRQVAWVMEKMNRVDSVRADGPVDRERTSSEGENDQKEDLR
jgi:hypothetical protein